MATGILPLIQYFLQLIISSMGVKIPWWRLFGKSWVLTLRFHPRTIRVNVIALTVFWDIMLFYQFWLLFVFGRFQIFVWFLLDLSFLAFGLDIVSGHFQHFLAFFSIFIGSFFNVLDVWTVETKFINFIKEKLNVKD